MIEQPHPYARNYKTGKLLNDSKPLRTITDVMGDINALFKQLDLLEAEMREINYAIWQKKNGM